MSDRFDFDTDNDDLFETDEATITDNQEENTVTETIETTTDDKAAKQAQADAEHQPSVDAFEAVVNQALASADPTTGTVSETDLEAVSKAYAAVTGGIKYKNAAKKLLDEGMRAALSSTPPEYQRAVSLNSMSEKLKTAAPAPRAAAPKQDPKEAAAWRYAALEAALTAVADLNDADEELDGWREVEVDDVTDDLAAHVAWSGQDKDDRGDEPSLSVVGALASKLVKQSAGRAARKSGGGAQYSGPRRNVGNHIASAFAEVPSGTFLTISEIVKHKSEEYGDDAPSSGAVSARLFPGGDPEKCNVEGVTPTTNDDSVKGAVKN